jgi:hypothetical protein
MGNGGRPDTDFVQLLQLTRLVAGAVKGILRQIDPAHRQITATRKKVAQHRYGVGDIQGGVGI